MNRELIYVCPSCNSPDIIKRGKRYNQLTEVQKYQCKECLIKFCDGNRHRFPEEVISYAINLVRDGSFSLNESSDEVYKKYGIRVSRQTIHKWLIKFDKHNPKDHDEVTIEKINKLFEIGLRDRRPSFKEIRTILGYKKSFQICRWKISKMSLIKRIGSYPFIDLNRIRQLNNDTIRN